jgi:hypothetical protein
MNLVTSILRPLLCPLLGRIALWRPGVDGCDLGLQCAINESVPCEGGFLDELGGDDESGEGLAAAA